MQTTKISLATPYQAPGHHDMVALRLQGFDASDTSVSWMGLSHFLPGGGAVASGSPLERMYVVVAGEMTVIAGGDEVVLGVLDSVSFAPGEVREVVNRSTLPASMLVIMPYPPTVDEV